MISRYNVAIFFFRKAGGRLVGFECTLEAELTQHNKSDRNVGLEARENYTKKLKFEESEVIDKIVNDNQVEYEENVKVTRKRGKKRKTEETEIYEPHKDDKVEVDAPQNTKKSKKRKNKEEINEESNESPQQVKKIKNKKNKDAVVTASVPSMANFFDTDDKSKNDEESSDEDDADVKKPTKKNKMTAAERAELAKKEEERVRKIENELADPNRTPETAEQFERLVLANPNSSKIWTQYIAFYLSVSENFLLMFMS